MNFRFRLFVVLVVALANGDDDDCLDADAPGFVAVVLVITTGSPVFAGFLELKIDVE